MLRINGRTIYAIHKDSQKKSIALWGSKDRVLSTKKILELAGVKISLSIYSDNNSTEEFLDEKFNRCIKPGEYMIVLLQDDYETTAKILNKRGYKPGTDYRWIKRYGMDNFSSQYMFDPIIGFNTLGDEQTPGFFAERKKNPQDKVLVVLGGSTSDPGTFHYKPWTTYLQESFDNLGIHCLVYNGAVTGYAATHEMLKLFRDVMALNPDCVVSMTGVNNNYLLNNYPFMFDYNLKLANYFIDNNAPTVNMKELFPYKPLKHDKSKIDMYTYWLNELKMMKYYCDLHDVKFYAFLQPNLMSKNKDKLLIEEKEYLANRSFMGRNGLTPEEYRHRTLGFVKLVNQLNYEWLIDLTNIFDHEHKTVYEDGIHTNEKGNKILSNSVLDVLYTHN